MTSALSKNERFGRGWILTTDDDAIRTTITITHSTRQRQSNEEGKEKSEDLNNYDIAMSQSRGHRSCLEGFTLSSLLLYPSLRGPLGTRKSDIHKGEIFICLPVCLSVCPSQKTRLISSDRSSHASSFGMMILYLPPLLVVYFILITSHSHQSNERKG